MLAQYYKLEVAVGVEEGGEHGEGPIEVFHMLAINPCYVFSRKYVGI